MEERCDADRHTARRESPQSNSFRGLMLVLQNGGAWSVGERGLTTARGDGSSTAACLDETEVLLLPFPFFYFSYELAVHDAVDICFA